MPKADGVIQLTRRQPPLAEAKKMVKEYMSKLAAGADDSSIRTAALIFLAMLLLISVIIATL